MLEGGAGGEIASPRLAQDVERAIAEPDRPHEGPPVRNLVLDRVALLGWRVAGQPAGQLVSGEHVEVLSQALEVAREGVGARGAFPARAVAHNQRISARIADLVIASADTAGVDERGNQTLIASVLGDVEGRGRLDNSHSCVDPPCSVPRAY